MKALPRTYRIINEIVKLERNLPIPILPAWLWLSCCFLWRLEKSKKLEKYMRYSIVFVLLGAQWKVYDRMCYVSWDCEKSLNEISLNRARNFNNFCMLLQHHVTDYILYSTVLHCTVLYCTYCSVLYCIIMFCNVLYGIVLYCIVLYCTERYCTVLYCTKKVLLKTLT